MCNKFFLLCLILNVSVFISNCFAQDDSSNFDFEYTWGIYGHNKVSSKTGKVYVKNKFYKYVDTTIVFTSDDKKMILEEMKKKDLFSYPDTIDCCDYDEEIERENPDEIFGKNKWTSNIDSLETDSGFLFFYEPEDFIIYCLPEIMGMEEIRKIKIFYGNQEKLVQAIGVTPYYEKDGEKVYLHNSKCVEFYRICEIIEKLTKSKDGFKNLPESHATYE